MLIAQLCVYTKKNTELGIVRYVNYTSIKLLQRERGKERRKKGRNKGKSEGGRGGRKEGRGEGKCQHQNFQNVPASWKKKNSEKGGEEGVISWNGVCPEGLWNRVTLFQLRPACFEFCFPHPQDISCVNTCVVSISPVRLQTTWWSEPHALCSLLYPWRLEQGQTQSRSSRNTHRMNQWMSCCLQSSYP